MDISSFTHALKETTLQMRVIARQLEKQRDERSKYLIEDLEEKIQRIESLFEGYRQQVGAELLGDAVHLRSLNLLWLDDKIKDYKFIVDELQHYGFSVYVSESVESALEIVRDRQVDGAIVDLQLGGPLSGLDFIERTRGLIPSIVCSSYLFNPELQRRAIQAGSVGVIEKNLNPAGDNLQFARQISLFFSEERRLRSIEDYLRENTDELSRRLQSIDTEIEKLPEELRDTVKKEILIISSELEKESPDTRRVSRSGSVIANVLQGAAGNLTAAGILGLLSALL